MIDADKQKSEADSAFREGRLDEARRLYEEVVDVKPEWAAAHNNLAMVLRQLGELAKAEGHFEKALGFDPNQPSVLSNLGALLIEQQRLDEAQHHLDRAIELAPDYAGAFYNRALLFQNRNDLETAEENLKKAIQLNPTFETALVNLGKVYRQLDRNDEAKSVLQNALTINPFSFEAHINLGTVLAEQGDVDGSIKHYQEAVKLDPNSPEAHFNMGTALIRVPNYSDALKCFEKTLSIDLRHKGAAINRSKALWVLDRRDDAIMSLERVLSIDPGFSAAMSNIVFKKNYEITETPESLYAQARKWNDIFSPTDTSHQFPPSQRDGDRVLNIAYLSPHFHHHPVGHFLEPIVQFHDPSQVKVYCYSDNKFTDELSDTIRNHADVWTNVSGDSNAKLAARIRMDGIDILVDLDGHSGPNRLPVFAQRAAPVQVTWAGYVGTTGLDAMDYLITDNRQTRVEDLPFLSESPIFMPGNYVCIRPINHAPEPSSTPGYTNGFITFGSFNVLDKLNDSVVDLWVKCLNAVPESRLKLIAFDLGDPIVKDKVARRFTEKGISQERLLFSGKLNRQALLSAYNTIDIALDPFPYSGGLTTLEALWMGVPVITRSDADRFAGRHSVTHLTAVGVTELIADNAEDYVNKAVALAMDTDRLSAYRSSLRDRLAQSPACDGVAFARHFERACRIMWRRWCNNEIPSPIETEDLVSASIEREAKL